MKREVIGRYRGSMLGILWSFFNPVFMLAVYTFVFSVVFKARWGLEIPRPSSRYGDDSTGMLVFGLFSEASRAPGLILANVNYVKKILFPLEILPWVALGSSVFTCSSVCAVWLLFYVPLFGCRASLRCCFRW